MAAVNPKCSESVQTTSVPEQPDHHAADVILSAEEDRQHPHRFARLVDVEPEDRPPDREIPHAGQDAVMAFAPVRRREDPLGSRANLDDPRLRAIERALRALAEIEIAAQKMVEYQLEVALGLG